MKWLKWCAQLLLTVILVSSLTLLTTGLIVQSYITSLLASFNITWEGAPTSLASVFQGALGVNTSTQNEEGSEQSIGTSEDPPTETGEWTEEVNETEPTGQAENLDVPDAETDMDTNEESSSGANSGNSSETGISDMNDSVVITPEDITDQKDSISAEDKTAVFELLMTKIPTDEMQLISGAMENGLTETELQTMEQIIAKYLTEEEYKDLMAILVP